MDARSDRVRTLTVRNLALPINPLPGILPTVVVVTPHCPLRQLARLGRLKITTCQ